MEGNGIVNPSSNSIGAEVVAQRVALLRPNYKQMEYMFAVSRYFWWYDGGICKRRRHLCSMFAAEAVPLIKLAQLDGEYRCLDAIQARIRANDRMLILRRTSMIAKQTQFARFVEIVRGHSACISVCSQVFARIETEAGEPSRGTSLSAVVGTPMRLGSIFDNLQPVSSREFGDSLEIHGSTVKVHGDDRPRASGNHLFRGVNVEVEGGCIHVSKDRLGPNVADRLRRRKEGICRH